MYQVRDLTEKEIRALEIARQVTRKVRVRGRCDMILLARQGFSLAEIAQRVPCAPSTVARFISRYLAEGIAGLHERPRPGRPRRATPEYEERLLEVVAQEPAAWGLPYTHWTTAKLADYVAEQTGISITARQVENYLKVNDVWLRRPTGRRR